MSSSAAVSNDAAHEFGALNTLLLVVILGLCVVSAYLIKQNSFYYLPESACAILVGIIVGCLAKVTYPSSEEIEFLSFEPQMFFFLLLPPIIFEAGYSLKKKDFFANFWTVSLYAVFGTIISTFVIGTYHHFVAAKNIVLHIITIAFDYLGYLVYAVGLADMVHIDTSSPLEALMFGSLISAVDPVATLSVHQFFTYIYKVVFTIVSVIYDRLWAIRS
jgi:sodium/hydrogen exchanger 8